MSSAVSAPSLPAGYAQRPATLDDIPGVGALFDRSETALGLRVEDAVTFLSWVLPLSFVVLERDTVVVERDGQGVAFAVVMRDPAAVGSALDWFGVVDPQHLGLGLGSCLVEWAFDVARVRDREEGPFDIRTNIPAPDGPAHDLLTAYGLRHVRTMWTMHRDVTDVAAAEPPDGVTIRSFRPGRDERIFWEVAESAFEGHFGHVPSPFESWEDEWYRAKDWDPDRVLLAERDGVVVGETAWVQAGEDGYIATVGVLAAHRGRGIATALLRAAFVGIADAGLANATLGVDSENTTGAVGVYRSVGMEAVRESHVFERSAS